MLTTQAFVFMHLQDMTDYGWYSLEAKWQLVSVVIDLPSEEISKEFFFYGAGVSDPPPGAFIELVPSLRFSKGSKLAYGR